MKETAQATADSDDASASEVVTQLLNDPDASPETLIDAWRCFVLAPALQSQRQN